MIEAGGKDESSKRGRGVILSLLLAKSITVLVFGTAVPEQYMYRSTTIKNSCTSARATLCSTHCSTLDLPEKHSDLTRSFRWTT